MEQTAASFSFLACFVGKRWYFDHRHRIIETVQGQKMLRRQKRVASLEHALNRSDVAWCLCCNSQQNYASSSQDLITVNRNYYLKGFYALSKSNFSLTFSLFFCFIFIFMFVVVVVVVVVAIYFSSVA